MSVSEIIASLNISVQKLKEASDCLLFRNQNFELAFLKITEAEAELNRVFQDLSVKGNNKFICDILEPLLYSDRLSSRPLHVARICVDALIHYEQEKVFSMPSWDIEIFRGISQQAKWRQEADSSLSQMIGTINTLLERLRSK